MEDLAPKVLFNLFVPNLLVLVGLEYLSSLVVHYHQDQSQSPLIRCALATMAMAVDFRY